MCRHDGTIYAISIDYIDYLQILTDRIKKFNAKLIRDKSGLRLARVLHFTLKMVKYAPLERHGWQPLLEFLSKKEAILNIQNNDKRCFGYAILYFLERKGLPVRHCYQSSLYKEQMVDRHHLETLPYPILPKNVPLYEDQLQMNINLFFLLMRKVALAISWRSAVKITNELPV